MCSNRRFAQFSTLLLALLLSVACGGGEEPVATAPEMGPIIAFGQAEVRDLAPTTQVVPNCSGITAPVVNHPSMTVGSAHSVEWQVGGTMGMGATIGQGVVPAGINLQAALEGHVANDLTNSIQQTSAWDLPAEPGYIMEYTIMWREVWQPAYLDVTFLDPEPDIMRIDVRYRTGIRSEIVGQKATLCDPGSSPQTDPVATQPLPITITVPTVTDQPTAETVESATEFDVCQGIATYPGYLRSESRFPPGTSTDITVDPGQIHVITAGPISIAGVHLRGGTDRGSVVVMLPSATYSVTDLVATWNWYGEFELAESEWEHLADTLAIQQMIPGTCNDSDGCSYVDVLVVGPDGVILQQEITNTQNVTCE